MELKRQFVLLHFIKTKQLGQFEPSFSITKRHKLQLGLSGPWTETTRSLWALFMSVICHFVAVCAWWYDTIHMNRRTPLSVCHWSAQWHIYKLVKWGGDAKLLPPQFLIFRQVKVHISSARSGVACEKCLHRRSFYMTVGRGFVHLHPVLSLVCCYFPFMFCSVNALWGSPYYLL